MQPRSASMIFTNSSAFEASSRISSSYSRHVLRQTIKLLVSICTSTMFFLAGYKKMEQHGWSYYGRNTGKISFYLRCVLNVKVRFFEQFPAILIFLQAIC